MRKILVAIALSAILLFVVNNEAKGDCTISGGTSIPGCNSATGGAGGNATSNSNPTQNNNQTNSQTNNQTNSQTSTSSAEVKDVKADAKVDVKTGDNNLKTGDVKSDQSNQQRVTVPVQPVSVPAPNNTLPSAGQTHKPEGWVNTFSFRPKSMTYEQAERCASGAKTSATWDGGKAVPSREILLFWEDKGDPPPVPRIEAMTFYLGTAKAEDYERSSAMSVLCSAALQAMRNGAASGFVKYEHQPQSYNSSFGIGGVGGGSAVLQSGSSPRAIVGAVAPAIGSATAYVRGNLLVHIQGFCLVGCQIDDSSGNNERVNTTNNTPMPIDIDPYPNG